MGNVLGLSFLSFASGTENFRRVLRLATHFRRIYMYDPSLLFVAIPCTLYLDSAIAESFLMCLQQEPEILYQITETVSEPIGKWGT